MAGEDYLLVGEEIRFRCLKAELHQGTLETPKRQKILGKSVGPSSPYTEQGGSLQPSLR